MTHREILLAQNELIEAQTEFYNLTCELYHSLINKMVTSMDLPNNCLIKYEAGTDINNNVIENCVSINEGVSLFTINLAFGETNHDIIFETRKARAGVLTLKITIYQESAEFEVNIADVVASDYSFVYDFIGNTLIKLYKDARAFYKIL